MAKIVRSTKTTKQGKKTVYKDSSVLTGRQQLAKAKAHNAGKTARVATIASEITGAHINKETQKTLRQSEAEKTARRQSDNEKAVRLAMLERWNGVISGITPNAEGTSSANAGATAGNTNIGNIINSGSMS